MTFAGPRLQRLLVEFSDKMGDFCGDERILAENRRLNVAWGSTQLRLYQLRLYWRKEGVYASYTPAKAPMLTIKPIAGSKEGSL